MYLVMAFLGSFTHIPLESIPGYSGHYNTENVSLGICPTSLYVNNIKIHSLIPTTIGLSCTTAVSALQLHKVATECIITKSTDSKMDIYSCAGYVE